MTDRPKLSLVIPVYNEENILEDCVNRVCKFLDDTGLKYELIICDDNSNDSTGRVAKLLCYENSKVVYLRFHRRVGKGCTIKNALKVTRGEIIIFMDADLSTNLKHIPQLIKEVEKTGGVAVGTRSLDAKTRGGLIRVFLSAAYNRIVRLMFKTRIMDLQCGFKGIDAKVAEQLFPHVRSDGFVYDTELIVNAERLRVPVTSMPVEWRDVRSKDTSKVIPSRAIITMFADLIILRLSHLAGRTIVPLKETSGGNFTDETHGKIYEIKGMIPDVKNFKIFDLLRKLYITMAFG